jgi:lysophospholipase L1-like esterase
MEKKILAFGDSIMKGVVAEFNPSSNPAMKYGICHGNFADACSKLFSRKIFNFARFGSNIAAGKKYFDRNLDKICPGDYVVLEFGGNDSNMDWKAISENAFAEHLPQTTLRDFRRIYNSIIDEILERGGIPVLMSLPPVDAYKFFDFISIGNNVENLKAYLCGRVQYIADWHEKYNLEVFKIAADKRVHVIDITTAFLDHNNYTDYLCIDGMHPNEAGHQLIFGAVRDYCMAMGVC